MGNDISREFRIDVAKWINTVRDRQKGKGVFDEEDVKGAIIDPLLRILGWDVNDPREVKKEARIEGKRADYALKIDDDIKVIIEAKAFSISLDGSDSRGTYEKQAINYAYNQGIGWAILTNGETWRLYNAYWKTQSKLAFEINIGDFPREIEKIVLLTKDNVSGERLDEYFKGRVKRPHVDEEVTQVLLNARAALTESIIKLNEGFTTDELKGGIQRMLDRLLFMKICEDRDIRKFGQLRSLVGMVESDPRDKTTLTYYLTTAFRQFRDVYDGELFDENVVDRLKVDNKTLMDIIETLYVYDFSTINVDVLGRIYEDYLSNVLSKLEEGGLEWITDNRERKEHGQFYTPQYIVDYIVDNVGITKESRILDPACGSGAFLIKAYDRVRERYLEDEERHKGNRNNNSLLAYIPKEEITEMNKRILTENLYGVDLNPEAIELTKINLWLRSIQKDTELNKLDNNIQCGNSLIDDPEVAGDRAFKWEEEFSKVIEEGGFDVVIGNPPYLESRSIPSKEWNFYREKYVSGYKRFDLSVLFIEKAITLLRDRGFLGFIVSNKFTASDYGFGLRKFILENCSIKHILDVSHMNVFKDASTYPYVIILQKEPNKSKREKNLITIKKAIDEHNLGDSNEVYQIKQASFYKLPKFIFSINLTSEILGILDKIDSSSVTLNELCEMKDGIHTGNVRDKLLLNNKINENCKKLVTAECVDRYSLKWGGRWVNYDATLINKEDREYGSLRNQRIFEASEKLITALFGLRPEVSYDNKHFYANNSIKIILPKKKNIDLKYIMSILNSALLNFYYRIFFASTHVRGDYMQFYPQDFLKLPIRQIPEIQQKPLIELADRMLSLNRELNEISDAKKIIGKYGGGIGVKLKKIVMDSEYQNIEMSNSSAKVKKVDVELDDDIMLVKVNGGSILKYSEGDELRQQYTKLYLENIDPERLNEKGGMIRDRLLNLEIPDYRNSEVIKKIVNEAITRRSRIEEEIKETDNKIDQMVYGLYSLTDEEIKTVEESLN